MREKLKGFEEILLEVRKVTKVTTGWRRMRFRATILVGDRAWHVGLGTAKGVDVASAVQKATSNAYKNIFEVAITKDWSIPYMITNKYKACSIVLRPAGPGTGLKAWSSVRSVLELAGYSNILSKIIGSNNLLNNAITTIKAVTTFKVNIDNIQEVKAVEVEVIEDKPKKWRGQKRKTTKSRTQKSATQTANKPAPKKETKAVEKKETTPKKTDSDNKDNK